jgi:hypothetical protein
MDALVILLVAAFLLVLVAGALIQETKDEDITEWTNPDRAKRRFPR